MIKPVLYAFVTVLALVGILSALFLVPVSSKPTGCNADQRFSIIKGQIDEYNSKQTDLPAINQGVCRDPGSYKLYVF